MNAESDPNEGVTLEKFYQLYNGISQKTKIDIRCTCGDVKNIFREKAMANIKTNGIYTCRACSMTKHHQLHPVKAETKAKIGQRLTGIIRSTESRAKMSEAKLALYQTEHGIEMRENLSRLTAKGHSENKYQNSPNKGFYPSVKNNKLMAYASSYELRLHWLLEIDDSVDSYDVQINYSTGKNGNRGRCLDFLIHYKNNITKAVEVKPASRLWEQKNIDQINDSRANATKNGWEFEIYTEVNLQLGIKEIKKWADKFIENGYKPL